MGDYVAEALEAFVPQLHALLDKGILNEGQIKKVVKQREQHEYRLRRRTTLKSDFLACIEYEKKLLDYIRIQKRKLGIKKKGVIDSGCEQRISFAYDRMCKRFQGDSQCWFAWISHCKDSKSDKTLSKVYGRALQMLPRNPQMWISAADWEFTSNGNPQAARTLFQRGLRFNRTDKAMWIHYFKMEILYVVKLAERRKILGLTMPHENKKGSVSVKSIAGEDTAAAQVAAEEAAMNPSQSAIDAILKGAIPCKVVQYADQALESIDVLREMLSSCKMLPVSARDDVESTCLALLETREGNGSSAALQRIRRCMEADKCSKQSINECRQQLVTSCSNWTVADFEQAVIMVESQLLEMSDTKSVPRTTKFLADILDLAVQSHPHEWSLWQRGLALFEKMGISSKAMSWAKRAAEANPGSLDACRELLALMDRYEDIDQAVLVAEAAIQHLPISSSGYFRTFYIKKKSDLSVDRATGLITEFIQNCGHPVASILETVRELVIAFAGQLAKNDLGWVHLANLAQKSISARISGPILASLLAAVASCAGDFSGNRNFDSARQLLKQATITAGSQSHDVWEAYFNFESTYGTPKDAANVHRQAIASLVDPQPFMNFVQGAL